MTLQVTPPTSTPASKGIRQTMAWLHTWCGLLLGWVMFAIFLTGALAFFREEINLWSRPESHITDTPLPLPLLIERAQQTLLSTQPQVTQWQMRMPSARQPIPTLQWRTQAPGRGGPAMHIHPSTGQALTVRDTMGGDFFYRFHFELRTAVQNEYVKERRWMVSIATFIMFMALISGVVTHRRIFKDFFTFRPGKGGQRAWLDAHNVTGVLALPFFLLMTWSGLLLFHSMLMPAGIETAYRTEKGVDTNAYFSHLRGEDPAHNTRPKAPAALPAVPIQPLMDAAQQHWGDAHRVTALQVRQNAQGQVLVELTGETSERLQLPPERLLFDGTTAQIIHAVDVTSAASRTFGVLKGLHLAHFASPLLRWALFGLGVIGCAMIGTGLVLWSTKRTWHQRRQETDPTPWGERMVLALNPAVIAGLPLACASYLLANRLLPIQMDQRADAEIDVFFYAWAIALGWATLHASRRRWSLGWKGLWMANALTWLAVPVVNALTTRTHLMASLPHAALNWVAVDLCALCCTLLAAAVTWHLHTRKPPSAGSPRIERQSARALRAPA